MVTANSRRADKENINMSNEPTSNARRSKGKGRAANPPAEEDDYVENQPNQQQQQQQQHQLNDNDSENEEEEDEERLHMQQIDDGSYTEVYDPNQDKETKRKVRMNYRDLITNIEDNRAQYVEAHSNDLLENLKKSNDYFASVKTPGEATLDSKFLLLSADLGAEKAKRLKLNYKSFNTNEYLDHLVKFLKVSTPARSTQIDLDEYGQASQSQANKVELDFSKLNPLVNKYLDKSPSVDFMFGPLTIEVKQRTIRRPHVRLDKNKKDLVEPEQLDEQDIQKQENETAKNIMNVHKALMAAKKINYFEFIINPESFSQTIENMFYLSFNIRDGKARIDIEDGQPILSVCTPSEGDEGAVRNQIIMELDKPLYNKLIETYNIRSSVIKTRERLNQVPKAGKWYG